MNAIHKKNKQNYRELFFLYIKKVLYMDLSELN